MRLQHYSKNIFLFVRRNEVGLLPLYIVCLWWIWDGFATIFSFTLLKFVARMELNHCGKPTNVSRPDSQKPRKLVKLFTDRSMRSAWPYKVVCDQSIDLTSLRRTVFTRMISTQGIFVITGIFIKTIYDSCCLVRFCHQGKMRLARCRSLRGFRH